MKFFILMGLIFLFFPFLVYAWGGCPYSFVNDEAPGLCVRYTDSNHDQLCDNSQPSPQKQKAVEPDNYNFGQIVITILFLYGLTRYLILFKQQKKVVWLNWLTKVRFRRVLNYLLLISFLLSLITGLVDLFHLLGWLKISAQWLYWHIEFSIAFAVFALIHLIERRRNFFNFFK